MKIKKVLVMLRNVLKLKDYKLIAYWYYSQLIRIFWIKEFKIKYSWIAIVAPTALNTLFWLKEVYYEKFYSKLIDSKKILDLWWYTGDSPIYFSLNWSKVVCYEANPYIYKFLVRNTKDYPNIISHNLAVVWDPNIQEVEIFGSDTGMWMSIFQDGWKMRSSKVQTKFIWEILEENQFNWLKMDIEWAEFWILERMLNNNKFPFEKWYIEFHYMASSAQNDYNIMMNLFLYIQDAFSLLDIFNAHTNDVIKIENLDFELFNKIWVIYCYFENH